MQRAKHASRGLYQVPIWIPLRDCRPSCNTVAAISSRGAQARDEEGAGAKAHKGRWRAVLCARGSRRAQGSEPQERGPQHPQPSSFSHMRPSFRPEAPPNSQNSHIWPHAFPSQWPPDVTSHLAAVCSGPYKYRDPRSWPTIR